MNIVQEHRCSDDSESLLMEWDGDICAVQQILLVTKEDEKCMNERCIACILVSTQ